LVATVSDIYHSHFDTILPATVSDICLHTASLKRFSNVSISPQSVP